MVPREFRKAVALWGEGFDKGWVRQRKIRRQHTKMVEKTQPNDEKTIAMYQCGSLQCVCLF